jgi:hypothetical protein
MQFIRYDLLVILRFHIVNPALLCYYVFTVIFYILNDETIVAKDAGCCSHATEENAIMRRVDTQNTKKC